MFRLLSQRMFGEYIDKWHMQINNNNGWTGSGGNKLRTYKLFKQSFHTEQYCEIIMSHSHRSALAKFRCGVAPLRLETGDMRDYRSKTENDHLVECI